MSCVQAMLRLFDAQAMPSKFGADLHAQDGKEQDWATLLEMWWQFSVAWGLGGMLTEEGRIAYVSTNTCLYTASYQRVTLPAPQ